MRLVKLEVFLFRLFKGLDFSVLNLTVATLFIYWMFNLAEGLIEKLIFGSRFEHFFDPIFVFLFIGIYGWLIVEMGYFKIVIVEDAKVKTKERGVIE